VNAAEQIEVREVAPARLRDVTLLGRTLTLYDDGREGDPFMYTAPYVGYTVSVAAFDRGYGWTLRVSLMAPGGDSTGCDVHGDLADLERLWLERASLETPLLCAKVLDGMAVPAVLATPERGDCYARCRIGDEVETLGHAGEWHLCRVRGIDIEDGKRGFICTDGSYGAEDATEIRWPVEAAS
jgi:hypothetical protein